MVRNMCIIGNFFCLVFLLLGEGTLQAEEITDYSDFDLQVRQIAFDCRDQVTSEFKRMLDTNKLNLAQLFDTFYIPIANSHPQKFHTAYDKLTDQALRILLDNYLDFDKRLLFVVAVDRNGYLPTHNSRYSKPLTNDPSYNAKNNRTKRIFNDRTGLAAARNTKQFFLQSYERDTGNRIYDLSVPIYINDKHWGGIRIGYTH